MMGLFKRDESEKVLRESFLEEERRKARADADSEKIERLQADARRKARLETMPFKERTVERGRRAARSPVAKGAFFVAEGLRRAGRNLGSRARAAELPSADLSRPRAGVGGGLGRSLEGNNRLQGGLLSELKK